MSPFIRQSLSRNVLKSLVKGDSKLDYNKALGNVTALYRSAMGGSTTEVQIPLPSEEKPRFKPGELSDIELEQAIVALFDYFDANLQTLNTYLAESTKEMVMTRVWKDILSTIEGLLVPPLSETPSDLKSLTDKEVDIAFKWLKARFFIFGTHISMTCSFSSYEITFTLAEKVPSRWRTSRIKSTETLFLFGCTMTGTRTTPYTICSYSADGGLSGTCLWRNAFVCYSRPSAHRRQSRNASRACIRSGILGLSKIASKRKSRRKKSATAKPSCGFSECGMSYFLTHDDDV